MKKYLLLLALCLGLAPDARADFLKNLTSPGPLAKAHASLDAKCDNCHVPFKGIPNSACLNCHTGTESRVKAGRGPHAQFEKEGRKCSSCHTDHKGRDHALSPKVDDKFVHAITGFLLDGKHASAKCSSCHKPGPSGQPKWVDLPKTCSGCHTDAHKGTLGPKCESCHTAASWKPPTKTIGQHQLDMTQSHAGLACSSCHKGGAHLTAAKSSCGDCHEQKHGGTKAPCATCHNTKDWKSATFAHDFCTCILPGKHQTATCLSCHPAFKFTPTPFACASCHTKDRKHEDFGACSACHSSLSWKTKTFDHNRAFVGFKIEGQHANVGCENCHKQKNVFKGLSKTCEGCHKTPAHGEFGACATCHTVDGWLKTKFTHDKTAFPLDGNHKNNVNATCKDCHTQFKKGEFQKGPNQCATCHKDPHQGQFGLRDAPAAPIARVMFAGPVQATPAVPKGHGGSKYGCLDCHSTKGWLPSTVDPPKHAALFGFELKGQHAPVKCSSCHTDGQFAATPRDCNQCHMDRHRGKFAGRSCDGCHDESTWKHHPTFDHTTATGFALTGAHDGVPCANCHGADHEKLSQVKDVGCATCHTPQHGNQFGSNCTQCHSPTTKFKDVPAFDHKKTMFPLDRRHAAVACVSCHDAKKNPHLSPNCSSCHDNPHRGRTQMECDDCHRADRWTLVRFDHDRTIFPLRGRHFGTACRDCHTNDQFTGTRSECLSCHRADRLRADSEHMDHRAFSYDCSGCHKPFKW